MTLPNFDHLLADLERDAADAAPIATANATITTVARRQRALGELKERIEALLKIVNAAYDEVRKRDLPDLLRVAEQTKVSVDGVGTVYLTKDVHVSVKNADGLLAWLRAHGQEALIKPTVHPSTLKAWYQEQVEAGQPVPVDLLAVFEETKTAIRKR